MALNRSGAASPRKSTTTGQVFQLPLPQGGSHAGTHSYGKNF